MATRAEQPISQKDIEEFLSTNADFIFELTVLNQLHELGFGCDHAGTFQDPITEKIRNYDFRARKTVTRNRELYLAIECKNIRPASPLLVYATPRTVEESFHMLVRRLRHPTVYFAPHAISIPHPNPAYPAGDGVGRETDQPKRTNNGELIGNDAQTFEKLSQALNSTHDLVIEAVNSQNAASSLTAVAPVVVVPDGLLWQVDYTTDGKLLKPARQVKCTTLICRHQWKIPEQPMQGIIAYTISHLEIISFSALENRLTQLESAHGFFSGGDALLT